MNNNIKFWDKLSGSYDKQIEKLFPNAYKKMIEYTIKYLKHSDTVLDIGCGTGITTIEMSKYVKEIHALDVSKKMLNIAKDKSFKNKINNIIFYQKNIFSKDISKQSYDVIIAFNILCYIPDDDAFIKRAYELLKDGGLFISVTDCLGEKETTVVKFKKILSKIGIIPNTNMYTITELNNKINNCNFEILQNENLHTIPPNYYIIAKKRINKK